MDTTPKTFGDILLKNNIEDEAGRQACAVPMPGPVADALAIPQEIAVGTYKVRPFYDADFEFLQQLKHPFFYSMTAGLQGKAAPETTTDAVRGPHAWNLCYLMTHSVEEGEEQIAKGTLAETAKGCFSKSQMDVLFPLHQAIQTQMTRYWGPVLSFGADTEKKKEEAKASANPPLSVVPLTGTAG